MEQIMKAMFNPETQSLVTNISSSIKDPVKAEILFSENGKFAKVSENGFLRTMSVGQLVPQDYDTVQIEYDTAPKNQNAVKSVTYMNNGAIVAKITLQYDTKRRLIGVERE
jgi:hypothetical protein